MVYFQAVFAAGLSEERALTPFWATSTCLQNNWSQGSGGKCFMDFFGGVWEKGPDSHVAAQTRRRDPPTK